MIEARIPKEIRVYKEKFLFGLTFRQTICCVLALVVNVPLYIWLTDLIGADGAGWIVMITAIPLGLVGFIRYNGMNFEKFAWCILKFEFTQQKRKYITENFYSHLLKSYRMEEKENALNNRRQKQRKRKKGGEEQTEEN